MKAVFLTKKTNANSAFEIKEIGIPKPKQGEVVIKVKSFGLNYADVMARLDLYPDMPKMPCVLGYDVLGEIHEIGEGVDAFQKGDFVVALTRFGGYAEYAVADARVCVCVSKDLKSHNALAIATQLSTAYHAAVENVTLFENDIVLVHAAAGGVGLGIVSIALSKKCIVIGIAGSDAKCDFLKSLGVQHTINYKKEAFDEGVKRLGFRKKIDVIFDSVGGENVPKGMKILNSDGKLVLFGSAKLSESKNKLKIIYQVFKFGFFSPIKLLMPSKSIIGINMLAIADNKPQVIQRCMHGVLALLEKGVFKAALQGETYSIDQLALAHEKLELGRTMGKLAIEW
jgi:NADPH2:quinone reductase